MARYTDGRRQLIDPTVERWKDRCLLGDGSLLFDDREGVWTAASAEEMYRRFNENALEGAREGGTFDSKWAFQLEGANETVRLFAAELVLVHFLFAMSVSKEGKLRVIESTLGEDGPALPDDADAIKALAEGIGHPGIGFNTRRDLQIAYMIDFVTRLKALEHNEVRLRAGERPRRRDSLERAGRRLRGFSASLHADVMTLAELACALGRACAVRSRQDP